MTPFVSRGDDLTEREEQVSALVAQGYNNESLAANLGISIETVKRHLSTVFAKARVNNRTELAAWYITRQDAMQGKGTPFRLYADKSRWAIDSGVAEEAIVVNAFEIRPGCMVVSARSNEAPKQFLCVTAKGVRLDAGKAIFH